MEYVVSKVCKKCQISKTIECFQKDSGYKDGVKAVCKACIKSYDIEYRKQNKEKIAKNKQNYHLKNPHVNKNIQLRIKYGITVDQYNQMLITQEHKCAICKTNSVSHAMYKNFVVDHNHRTGQVRALLCHSCNTTIGASQEDIDRLIKCAEYLKAHNG